MNTNALFFVDEDAVLVVAKSLEMTEKDVRFCVRVSCEYMRVSASLKAKKRNEQEKETKKRQIQKQKEEHPEDCFCIEDNYEVPRSTADEIVGHWDWYSPYDYHKENPVQDNYYRCARCGKRYWVPTAFG